MVAEPAFVEPFAQSLRDARNLDIPSAAGNLIKSVLLFYTVPEHQAFLAGAFLGAAATRRLRPAPMFIASYVCGLAAEKTYLTMRDVRAAARAITARNPGGADPSQP